MARQAEKRGLEAAAGYTVLLNGALALGGVDPELPLCLGKELVVEVEILDQRQRRAPVEVGGKERRAGDLPRALAILASKRLSLLVEPPGRRHKDEADLRGRDSRL